MNTIHNLSTGLHGGILIYKCQWLETVKSSFPVIHTIFKLIHLKKKESYSKRKNLELKNGTIQNE